MLENKRKNQKKTSQINSHLPNPTKNSFPKSQKPQKPKSSTKPQKTTESVTPTSKTTQKSVKPQTKLKSLKKQNSTKSLKIEKISSRTQIPANPNQKTKKLQKIHNCDLNTTNTSKSPLFLTKHNHKSEENKVTDLEETELNLNTISSTRAPSHHSLKTVNNTNAFLGEKEGQHDQNEEEDEDYINVNFATNRCLAINNRLLGKDKLTNMLHQCETNASNRNDGDNVSLNILSSKNVNKNVNKNANRNANRNANMNVKANVNNYYNKKNYNYLSNINRSCNKNKRIFKLMNYQNPSLNTSNKFHSNYYLGKAKTANLHCDDKPALYPVDANTTPDPALHTSANAAFSTSSSVSLSNPQFNEPSISNQNMENDFDNIHPIPFPKMNVKPNSSLLSQQKQTHFPSYFLQIQLAIILLILSFINLTLCLLDLINYCHA